MFENRDDFSRHISSEFNNELENLSSLLLKMGGVCESQLALANGLIDDFNSEIFDNLIAEEQVVNAMELKIDEKVAEIIARRQPIASDLRMVLVVSKIVRDVERVGDEAHKIGKIAAKLGNLETSSVDKLRIKDIEEQVQEIFSDALSCFVRLDPRMASSIVERDAKIDESYKRSVKKIISCMGEARAEVEKDLLFIWVLRSLERIGDHSKNIAEQIIYLVRGTDIRHPKIKNIDKVLYGANN